LDPEQLDYGAQAENYPSLAGYSQKLEKKSPTSNALYKQDSPIYSGQDYYKNKISELEYALRQEILKNEET
jgi:hypothetical protein